MSPPKPRRAARVVLLGLALAACGAPRRATGPTYERTSSRVDVYLRALPSGAGAVELSLAGARLVDAAGEERPLALLRQRVTSTEASGGVALAGGGMEPGAYRALALTIAGAALLRDGTRTELTPLPAAGAGQPPSVDPGAQPGPLELVLPLEIAVQRRDAVAVFLDWDVEASLVEGDGLRLALAPRLEVPQVRLGRLYVADAAAGSVLTVERGTGTVVGTGKVGAEPRALALSGDRRWLFVANAADGSVTVLDTRRNQAEFTVPVRLGAGTVDVAVADERRWLVAANRDLDTVSFIELGTFTRVEDVRVGRAPLRLAVVPELRRVFTVDSLGSTVSVIDVVSRKVLAALGVEAVPTAIAADRRGRELFVGHRDSPNLVVIDAASLGAVDTIYVGGNVTEVLADRRRDRVYVARSRPAELAVVDRGLRSVVRRIPLRGAVAHLTQPTQGNLLYGAAPALGGLVVVDVVVGEERPFLACGSLPSDVIAVD